jgi:hypothetical protein
MDPTPNLQLPYIYAAQAQKHVTHNEAIRMLDALVQIAVADRDLTAPPATPAEGARYIVAASATGAWAGRDGEIAAWQDGAWAFYPAAAGWLAWVADESRLVVWNGTAWTEAATQSTNPTPLVGVNATADATNRLAVSSPASLLNHAGAGHQQKINKATPADTASVLYQTDFSGRAELGLAGDDDWRLKVSADGASWSEAVRVERATGRVYLPATPAPQNLLLNPRFQVNQRGFAGGPLAAGAYGFDRWKAGAGGCEISAANDVVSHVSGTLIQVVEAAMWDRWPLAPMVLSVDSLTGGDLNVTCGSASGTITAGAGRRSFAFTRPNSAANFSIELTPAAGPVTYRWPMLELGVQAGAWRARPLAEELRLCERYLQVWGGQGGAANQTIAPGFAGSATNTQCLLLFRAPLRTTPTVALAGTVATDFRIQVAGNNFLAPNAITPLTIATTGCAFNVAPSSNLTVGQATVLSLNGAAGRILVEAEL